MKKNTVEDWFRANYLDGDEVQDGQMLSSKECLDALTTLHQELQKAREEEREKIEAIFKEHIPPHAMDLEDSVWLKRLLNKAFGHENIY